MAQVSSTGLLTVGGFGGGQKGPSNQVLLDAAQRVVNTKCTERK